MKQLNGLPTPVLPVLVVADRQTEGRGRQGRSWAQARSCDVLLARRRIGLKPEHLTLVPLIAGVVVSEAIAVAAGVVASLKWPNDILVAEGKTGGNTCRAFRAIG